MIFSSVLFWLKLQIFVFWSININIDNYGIITNILPPYCSNAMTPLNLQQKKICVYKIPFSRQLSQKELSANFNRQTCMFAFLMITRRDSDPNSILLLEQLVKWKWTARWVCAAVMYADEKSIALCFIKCYKYLQAIV